jgi:hypothetical protein
MFVMLGPEEAKGCMTPDATILDEESSERDGLITNDVSYRGLSIVAFGVIHPVGYTGQGPACWNASEDNAVQLHHLEPQKPRVASRHCNSSRNIARGMGKRNACDAPESGAAGCKLVFLLLRRPVEWLETVRPSVGVSTEPLELSVFFYFLFVSFFSCFCAGCFLQHSWSPWNCGVMEGN